MLLNKIEFKNYRCFLNGEIEFQSERPINLVLGINGSGKTELLIAIWYVLHGFDFSSLKAKENDPYSLNSQVYQRLQKGPSVYNESSEVKLTFEHENKGVSKTYVLTRIENYEKGSQRSTEQYVTLYNYENGQKSPLNTDQKNIADIIDHIIPLKVLSGIMFDGERMMNLSSEDENSIKAIEGTIEDVTNLKLFTSLIEDLSSLDKKYTKEIRKIGRKSSNNELELLSDEILNLKDIYGKNLDKQEKLRIKIPKFDNLISKLSLELKEFSEAKVIENERENLRKHLIKLDKELEKTKYSLQDKEFKNISPMLSTGLLAQVENLIETNKLPKGLTSNAVYSILKRENCICGRPHTDDTRKDMGALMRELPPENLNALINEWVVDFKGLKRAKSSEIDEIFDEIEQKNEEIEEVKREINRLSTKISSIDNKELLKKEKEKNEVQQQYFNAKNELSNVENELSYVRSELDKKISKQEELTKSDDTARLIQEKISFIKKAEKMVDRIKEINMSRALLEINGYMSDAYSIISEDYPRGRRVYISQFVKEKYKLISYYKNDLKHSEDAAEFASLQRKYKDLDFNNPNHLREAHILDVAANNSTGQSKIMTMSFVKAILDFSSKDKKDQFNTKRQYPLVLDAPFSEISGDNLIKSAENLYRFNKQIILLSDPNTYEPLKEYMNKNIGSIYYLDKNDGESSTTIRKI